jgi:hypothetical protein
MNLNNENNMVYVVMGGVNYEGESAATVKVFMDVVAANEYGESLVKNDYYDYSVIFHVVGTYFILLDTIPTGEEEIN